MTNDKFTIKTYGKSELAMLYMQTSTQRTAMKLFNVWLKVNPRLRHLANSHTKYFTPKQVRLIVEELGEPFELE